MEELQSTHILDLEILNDARKKASRILKTADDSIHAQTEDWEKRTAELIDDLDKKYRAQYESAAAKITARALIDKHRILIEKVEDLLQSAVDTWFSGASRENVIDLLSDDLKEKLEDCEEFALSKEINVRYHGLEKNEAEKILKKIGIKNPIKVSGDRVQVLGKFPSIILESKNISISSSIQKTIDHLLHKKRAELTEALIGRIHVEERI